MEEERAPGFYSEGEEERTRGWEMVQLSDSKYPGKSLIWRKTCGAAFFVSARLSDGSLRRRCGLKQAAVHERNLTFSLGWALLEFLDPEQGKELISTLGDARLLKLPGVSKAPGVTRDEKIKLSHVGEPQSLVRLYPSYELSLPLSVPASGFLREGQYSKEWVDVCLTITGRKDITEMLRTLLDLCGVI